MPLSEEAVAALSHNAMALDIYRWLASGCIGSLPYVIAVERPA